MTAVIYSALIGGYERPIPQILEASADIEMVMFTDTPSKFEASSPWTVVKVDPRFPTDPVRSARYLKTVGHPELDQYDCTIWADNRVVLKPAALALVDLLDRYDLVLPDHSGRATIRDEYSEVIASGYDDPARVRSTYSLSKAYGVDLDTRPLWTGILLRRRNDRVAECMRLWMDNILVGSRRDQLSIHAALSNVPLATHVLDIDNVESAFHQWIPVPQISRKRAVQAWRPPSRSVSLRFADALRSRPHVRRAARVLERVGKPLPTLGSEGKP